jgi:transcriptional regulator with XRE-family HTH domain
MSFKGEYLKRLRGDQRQRAVAKVLGVETCVISQWETGLRKPTLEHIEKLAEYFKCPVSVILGETVNPVNETEALLLQRFRRFDPVTKEDISLLIRKFEEQCDDEGICHLTRSRKIRVMHGDIFKDAK